MKYKGITSMAVCFFVVAISQALIAQTAASAKLSNNAILIGDQLTLSLHASFPKVSEAKGFDFSALDTVKAIEVVKIFPPVSATPEQIDQEVLITSFEAGIHTIPSLLFSISANGITDSIYTDSLRLEVKTLPIASDTIRLQPIKDIIPEPQNLSDWAPLIAFVLGLLALAVLLYFIFRKPRKDLKIYQRRAPKLPPHEVALQQLDILQAEALWQKGELKAYYSRLTFIIRQYLEDRFEIKALESTSDEIVAGLRRLPAEEEFKAAITRLLYAADLVKFAKATPTADSHDRHWDSVRQFVIATQPIVEPEAGKK